MITSVTGFKFWTIEIGEVNSLEMRNVEGEGKDRASKWLTDFRKRGQTVTYTTKAIIENAAKTQEEGCVRGEMHRGPKECFKLLQIETFVLFLGELQVYNLRFYIKIIATPCKSIKWMWTGYMGLPLADILQKEWFDWKMKVKVLIAQLCLTLCDCQTPLSVHWILQARILELLPYPSPGQSSQPRDWTQVSCTVSYIKKWWVKANMWAFNIN